MPFRDLVGHRPVLAWLARAAADGSLPASLLFTGPEGVGKHRAALALAQLLNCPARRDPPPAAPDGWPDACGVCGTCTRIVRGAYPDVVELAPGDSGAIKIDQARAAIDQAAFRPFEGRRRVFIVDPAEALGLPAQDALLKTLEEPPRTSVFVLVTACPDALLPTVVSRCQRVRFGRLRPEEIARVLVAVHRYEEGAARAAASMADGSLARALAGGAAAWAEARAAALALVEGAARSEDPVARLELAKAFASGGRTGADREGLAQRLQALACLLRDLEVVRTRADTRWLANGDLAGPLAALADAFDGARVRRAFSAVDRALGALERNASPKLVADWLAVTL
jgi:DNA polymerase-3 subunit delta'